MRRAIVLSGGGARGAYEAGVLRYLLSELPRRLGFAPRLDILCGTSVGALTACWLAATADQGPERADRFEAVWREMRAEELLRWRPGHGGLGLVANLVVDALRAALLGRSASSFSGHHGLLDRAPFEALVLRSIPWRRIRANRIAGRFDALSVTATDVASGRAVVFLESRDGAPRHWTPDPTIVASPADLAPEHALASAAIPFVFPSVEIDGRRYVDGALRVNTPLVPALRFGADRILVIALRASLAAEREAETAATGESIELLGKVMNAVLLDPVEADLGRMRFVNDVLRRAQRTFGEDSLARLNETARQEGAQPLKLIEETVIRPSEDPCALAAEAVARLRKQGRLPALLRVFGRPQAQRPRGGADLLSYLVFDSEYTAALADLGFEDARRREEDLARFFGP